MKKVFGFTLIELMIVIAIVGVIAITLVSAINENSTPSESQEITYEG